LRAARNEMMPIVRALGFVILLVVGAGLTALYVIPGCANDAWPPAPGWKKVAAKPVNNADCLTCHMDFKAELIAVRHAKAGIGCTSCHGDSLAHGDDEFNITPPDVMFGRAEIKHLCQTCHKTHRTGAAYAAFVKKWHSKRRPNGRMILDDSVCTDCHGKHAVLTPDKQLGADDRSVEDNERISPEKRITHSRTK